MTEASEDAALGLALRSLLQGVLLGTAVIAAVLWVVRTIQASSPPESVPDPGGLPALLLMGGTFAGVLAGGMATWFLLAPFESLYRRGGLAMVAGFASLPLSLVSMPLDRAFGRAGLLALSAVAVLAFALLSARRPSPAR
jgi:hypothetical protein